MISIGVAPGVSIGDFSGVFLVFFLDFFQQLLPKFIMIFAGIALKEPFWIHKMFLPKFLLRVESGTPPEFLLIFHPGFLLGVLLRIFSQHMSEDISNRILGKTSSKTIRKVKGKIPADFESKFRGNPV